MNDIMSTAEQLSFNDVRPELDPSTIESRAFSDASNIAEHFARYGDGAEQDMGQRYFFFEHPLHYATERSLVSILEIEATQIFESRDIPEVTVYKLGDAFIFREEIAYEDRPGAVLYTGYIDCN
jgi:hypothetical protein